MAWIRTAVSLVGFGFSIPQFFRYMRAAGGATATPEPQYFGLMLIGLGTLSLLAGMFEHVRLLHRIAASCPVQGVLSAALGTAVMMFAFGVYAFIQVLVRT